ncbi:ArsR/SmtB family transcription factor [Pinibacter aurantiacus]|uniref:Winged helix-turn-helix domain-containing protein n=1 Tax=Pinibacter aurantiacus TaxID=2851599 RepID=A0A9E2S4W5_9BACT|nr:winged helix-turn-helix domain-containing protein [Pinibacter aurantiacus]MBV4355766.1 winged helix-turn-helix domain-containing protein [Pinibacter aurantiacus]
MEEQIVVVSSLIGDPVRAKILWALLDGKAYTATELAIMADTSPQNISMHVAKLVNANFLKVAAQGRHKYYTFARDEVAYVIEAMSNLIPAGMKASQKNETAISPIKYCRTCYDHLAGKVGVSLTEKLLETKMIRQDGDEFSVTRKGTDFFKKMEIDLETLRQSRRFFAKPCLDWSERKYHMAGSLGAALLNKMLSCNWIRRTRESRAIIVTARGQKAFLDYFNMKV